MSDFAKTAAMMIVGGVVGVGGFVFLTHENSVEAAPTPQVAAVVEVEQTPPLEPAEVSQPNALTVVASTTGGVERNREGAAFAVFDITADEDVSNAELVVTGAPGTRPQEAIGAEFHRSGDRMTIDLGELQGSERKQVVVAMKLGHDSGDFTYYTTHKALHGDRETVQSESIERGVARKHRSHDAYKIVRQRYSEDTLEIARHLRDNGEYEDALDWVRDAHQANVEVGMAVRLTGELAGYQKDLNALEDELKELMKPKAKPRAKVEKKTEIEVYRLDKPNWR